MSYSATRNPKGLHVVWTGPYGWPGYSLDLPTFPRHSGVCLQTVENRSSLLVYAAGLTRKTFSARFTQHTRQYLTGGYHVLGIAAMQQGIR